MKRLALVASIFLAATIWAGFQTTSFGQSRVRAKYANDRIIVKLRSTAADPSDDIGDRILSTRGTRSETTSAIRRTAPRVLHLNGTMSVEEALLRAAADPDVEYVEPDYFIHLADKIPNDTFFTQMWGLLNEGSFPSDAPGADIAATKAWDVTTGADNVIVAVIDSGVDVAHPDLAANIWVNGTEIPNNGVDEDGNGFTDDVNGWDFFSNDNTPLADPALGRFYGHGTHVAGTIGAVGNNELGVAGVAWHVKILSLKVFGFDPDEGVTGTTSDAVRAINYAISLKNRGENVRVCNASWSGDESSKSLREAIRNAGDAGIVFVCAAGNFANDMDDPQFTLWPAAWNSILPNLISVAAIDRSDQRPSFSNYGHATVDVGAPGVDILSTFPGGGYQPNSGTSMSTPHVSGIAALLAAHQPSLSAAAIKERIVSTSQPIASLASKVSSAGRVNAFNALTNAKAPIGNPVVTRVEATTKKLLTVDGIGFAGGVMGVEVNGVGIPVGTRYDEGYVIGNGSFTRISLKTGKPIMRDMIPPGVLVNITVVNQFTGARSAPFPFVR